MQVVVLAMLKKLWPYLVLATIVLGFGFYLGYCVGSDGLAAAKLALSVQQADDAKAVATANAAAAAELVKANADANQAEASLTVADKKLGSQDTVLTTEIAAEAARADQDAPDAPVLSHTFDALGETP